MFRLLSRRGLLVLLPMLIALGLFAIGRAAPMEQAAQPNVVFPVVVTVLKSANVRAGPGTEFAIVSAARAGQHVNVIGCNGDCSWYQLAEDCWIAAFLVQPEQPIAPPVLTPLTALVIPVPVSTGGIPMPTIVLSLPITTTQGALIPATQCPQTIAPTTTYAGPGESYGAVDMHPAGECIAVIGRNQAGDWYQLAHGAWIHAAAVIYGDPIETIPVTDQPYTPTPVLPPTPFITPTLAIIATPVPTVTVDLSEIMTVGDWVVSTLERKESTAALWTQRYISEGKISNPPEAFASDLLTCVDNTLAGTAEVLGASYPVQSVADGCVTLLQGRERDQ